MLLIDWLIDWMIDWLSGWLTDWLTDWLSDWLIYKAFLIVCCRFCSTTHAWLSIAGWSGGHQPNTDRVLLWRQNERDWLLGKVQRDFPVRLSTRRRGPCTSCHCRQPTCYATRTILGQQTQQKGERIYRSDVVLFIIIIIIIITTIITSCVWVTQYATAPVRRTLRPSCSLYTPYAYTWRLARLASSSCGCHEYSWCMR